MKTTEELEAEGWQFSFCPCGFFIITLPSGKHYCPKCVTKNL